MKRRRGEDSQNASSHYQTRKKHIIKRDNDHNIKIGRRGFSAGGGQDSEGFSDDQMELLLGRQGVGG